MNVKRIALSTEHRSFVDKKEDLTFLCYRNRIKGLAVETACAQSPAGRLLSWDYCPRHQRRISYRLFKMKNWNLGTRSRFCKSVLLNLLTVCFPSFCNIICNNLLYLILWSQFIYICSIFYNSPKHNKKYNFYDTICKVQ